MTYIKEKQPVTVTFIVLRVAGTVPPIQHATRSWYCHITGQFLCKMFNFIYRHNNADI